MDNVQVGTVTPFQEVQQQGCCCERITASPEKGLRHPYGMDFLRSYYFC
ncbi:MAG: hypothetical protein ABW185_14975 [Sedimenticola sp.]